MIIAFDLTPIYDHLTGVERYNINISKEIIKTHPENEYILIFKNEIHSSFKEEVRYKNVTKIVIPECNKLVFIQWKLYRILKKVKADFYIFLSFTSPVLFRKQKIINAIHDLTCWDCPQSVPRKMKYYYRLTYKVATRVSWRIVTVSKFSQKRICQKYKIKEDKVPIIYDGLTDIFKNPVSNDIDINKKYNLPPKYLLSLSTIEPRKNLQLLIKAYSELIEEGENLPDIVLAGRQGWKLEEIFTGITDKVKNQIHFTGFIDDEDLPTLYKKATAFVFPSKYEGFGLPIIEAMSQGTLVISSDAASLPEVVGEAGLMFRSDDLGELKEKLRYCINMRSEDKEVMTKVGRDISFSFSWNVEAEKLYQIMIHNS